LPVLEAINIAKTHSGHTVLEAGSLRFEKAQITSVCGPNGAGKTTLLRILALLDYPDEGEVLFQGESFSSHGDWFRARKKITMVDQTPYAFAGSVFRNVAYGLNIRGQGGAEAAGRVADALTKVGLSGFERRRARTISGGEVQRMAIARAIVCEPEVLILDEPTAHVDSARVREVEDLVLRLREEKGTTIIIATHQNDQACRLADRVLRIEKGRIGEDPSNIVSAKLQRTTRGIELIVPAPWTGPGRASIVSLELARDHVIIRLDRNLPMVRVPKNEVQQVKPLPGEQAALKVKK
jgi:tungstate transport system ATP-binding protein